jgi:hypothetical protein
MGTMRADSAAQGGRNVPLVNLDNLVILGPGSEWFWSMAQFVVVAVTLIAIYVQVRVQLHTTTFEQARELQDVWNSERMLRARLAVLEASQASPEGRDIPIGASSIIANHWETVGNLVKTGHVDLDQIDGLACRLFWARLSAFGFIELGRTRANDPEVLANFEWLATRYADQARTAGVQAEFDDATLASMLPASLRAVRESLAIEEELRAVIVRPAGGAASAFEAPTRPAKPS